MLKTTLILTLSTLMSATSFGQKKFNIEQRDRSTVITNTHGLEITKLTAGVFDFAKMNKAILESDHPDSKIIVSVLAMHSNSERKIREILSLRSTYPFFAEIVTEHLLEQLEAKYGKKKLKKLLRKKNLMIYG